MQRYRKRIQEIQAEVFDGSQEQIEHLLYQFPEQIFEEYEEPDGESYLCATGCLTLRVRNITFRCAPGTWICLSAKGELYPCSTELFAQLFEPLS